MILQNIRRRVVGNVLINISPSNVFLNLLSPAIFDKNCQTAFVTVSIDRLTAWLQLIAQILARIAQSSIIGPLANGLWRQIHVSIHRRHTINVIEMILRKGLNLQNMWSAIAGIWYKSILIQIFFSNNAFIKRYKKNTIALYSFCAFTKTNG